MRKVVVSLPEKEPREGLFHEFGSTANGVFAIVEYPDGTIDAPYVAFMKFKELPWPENEVKEDKSLFEVVFGK